jgi:carboxymethylenebutenolidase
MQRRFYGLFGPPSFAKAGDVPRPGVGWAFSFGEGAMGRSINLNTSTMQCIGAYVAEPEGKPRGGIVVVQEIFGVNAHVRSVADGFAAHGYTAIAPAFFDHVESGVELAYDEAGMKKGVALIGEIPFDRAIEDVGSAAESIASAGRIGVVGYCWGGTVALLSAIRLGLPAVGYYGGRNVNFVGETLRAPLMLHFGGKDKSIPVEAIERQRQAWPQAEIFVYPDSGHAFNRDVDPHIHDAAAAKLALDRTLDFFGRHLAAA